MNVLRLDSISHSRHQLSMGFSVAGHRFSTSLWYRGVDLEELSGRFGDENLQRIFFHIAAFELNKLMSLAPDAVDFGVYQRFQTERFEQLWSTVFENVWAQWRYENDRPRHRNPEFRSRTSKSAGPPVSVGTGEVENLVFCGGGKDSLVSLALMKKARLPFDTLAYSSSIYGRPGPQHALIEALASRFPGRLRQRLWMFEDFLDAPVTELCPEFDITTLTAAETPASVFAALPYALEQGYRRLIVGHERSADRGQMVWPVTGEEINHQWGKSFEAESLIYDYISSELIDGLRYFSILKPIYDALIFNLLELDLPSLPFAHSCNRSKPWCKRCPKCAYVWLNYMAYLPVELVERLFDGDNLFDFPENLLSYRRLMGLESRQPFECIGQVGEVRLALELCHRKSLSGKALDVFRSQVRPISGSDLLEQYLTVDKAAAQIPEEIGCAVIPIMEECAARTKERLDVLLGS